MDELVPAPSRIALRCESCDCFVTPCIVCAHPVAVAPDRKWKHCENCGLRNPLEDRGRQALGFCPALALPPAMVRRVQSALVGRRAYTLSIYEHKACLEDANQQKFSRKSLPLNLIEEGGLLRSTEEISLTQGSDASSDGGLTKCQGCGLMCEANFSPLSTPVLSNECSLVLRNTQLLELNCPQVLADDMSRSVPEFPICRVPERLTLRTSSCGAVNEFTSFSVKILELANQTLSQHLGELTGSLMVAAERFLSRKKALQETQASIRLSQAALKQASIDCNARDMFPTVAVVLEGLIANNLEHKRESAKEFTEFSQVSREINAVLEKLFSLAAEFSRDFRESEKTMLEAVRMATAQWLLLFHDVGHLTNNGIS